MNDTTTETVTVTIEREMPFPAERVWRAITEPHLIEEWLMKNDFKPAAGHAFKLQMGQQGGWDGVIDCKVLAVEPHKSLSYTWGTMGVETVVTLTLTPTGAGTHLRVEQSGFAPDRPQNYNGAKYGWDRFLGNLEQVLARGD
jgi:uncharacterized protein YndB with AHSA1/START domain